MIRPVRILAAAVVLSFLVGGPAHSQDRSRDHDRGPSGPFDNRITPRGEITEAPPAGVAAAVEEPKIKWFVAPSAARADGLQFLGGLGLGVLVPGALMPTGKPFRFDVGYSYIDPEDADHRDKFSVGAKYELGKKTVTSPGQTDATTLYSFNLSGRHADGRDSKQRSDLAVYGERFFGRWSVSASLGGARTVDSDGRTSDLIFNPGVAFQLRETLSVAVDYTFDNSVDDGDDYSLALSWDVTPSASLTLIAGKDSFVKLSGFFTF